MKSQKPATLYFVPYWRKYRCIANQNTTKKVMIGKSYLKAAVTLCNFQRNRKSATEKTRTAVTWLANTKKKKMKSSSVELLWRKNSAFHGRREYRQHSATLLLQNPRGEENEVYKLRGESAVARATSSFLQRPELAWGGWTSQCISVLLVAAASRCRPIFTTTQLGLQLTIRFGVDCSSNYFFRWVD